MTVIEYFEKMLRKHNINLAQEIKRNASEEILENIRFKIACCTKALEALIRTSEKPVKDVDTCARCKFALHNGCNNRQCDECSNHRDYDGCACALVSYGEVCPYFEEVNHEV